MSKAVFMIFSGFLLTLLQLTIGSCGWPLPLALMNSLYITLAFGRYWGLSSALLNALTLTILYGGSWHLLNIVTYPLLALLLDWWIKRHSDTLRISFWTPGAWAALTAALPAAAVWLEQWLSGGGSLEKLRELLYLTVWSAAVSALIFMLMILIGEALTEYLGLPRYLKRKGGKHL